MNIKLMKKTDFKNVYKLWQSCKLNLDDYKNEKKEFMDMLSLNPDSCFIATAGHQIIGSAFGTYNGRRAFMYHVAVHPDWQNKGVGKTLLNHVENVLKQKGPSKVWLMVDVDNLRVVPFYEKCGYKPYTNSILMRKKL